MSFPAFPTDWAGPFRAASKGGSILVALLGLSVLAGWALQIPFLQSVLPGSISMVPNSALCFLLSGSALFLLQEKGPAPYRPWGRGLAAASLLLAGLVFLQYPLGLDLGIDQLLFQDRVNLRLTDHPGRMALSTTLNFILLNTALLALDRGKKQEVSLSQGLAVISFLVALLIFTSYIYGAKSFYSSVRVLWMAFHTALGFLLFSLGVMFARPQDGFMRVASSSGPSGEFCRKVLLAVFVAFPFLGWLRLLGQHEGLYDTEFGAALMIILSLAALIPPVILASQALGRSEEDLLMSRDGFRRRAETTQEHLNRVLENSPVILWAADSKGIFTLYSGSGGRPIGGNPESRIGKSIFDLYASRKDILDNTRRAMAGESFMAVTRVGGRIFETLYSPALEEGGRPGGASGITWDVTEKVEAAEKLQTYSQTLERNNRDLQDFAFVASHDLQEPLRKVRSFGERLQSEAGTGLGERGADYLNRMLNAAARMQVLLEDLLKYSRVTTQAHPFSPISMGRAVQEALSVLEVRLEECQGQLEIGDLPELEADPVQMGQVFQNLLGNALKFRKPGVIPRIRVTGKSLEEKGEPWVEIRVEDNGIGFDPQYEEKIFQIFQRLHGRTEYEGTGVGLAICRRIVLRHGGTLRAEGKPGEGAAFILRLPARQGQG